MGEPWTNSSDKDVSFPAGNSDSTLPFHLHSMPVETSWAKGSHNSFKHFTPMNEMKLNHGDPTGCLLFGFMHKISKLIVEKVRFGQKHSSYVHTAVCQFIYMSSNARCICSALPGLGYFRNDGSGLWLCMLTLTSFHSGFIFQPP